ncbi:MAG: substrate-binding domain-containing protein [Clostridiales bacterium]|nr:substrate-binding domain-containing protein [Clostridiales bacterium]
MKKAAVVSVALLLLLGVAFGARREEVKDQVDPLTVTAGVQETTEAKEVQESAEDGESSRLPEIDTSLDLPAGARIAVVSKSTKGEFWSEIKRGMSAAVSAVNEAYGFSKSEQITMTFEGADSELDVETQINTLDAVISENPTAICISVSDSDSCQAQLEGARENGIPVVTFDSGVSEEEQEMVFAHCSSDNEQIGQEAAGQLAAAMGESGQVAVFSAQEKTQSIQDRVSGFLETIESYEDIEVVEVVYQDEVDDMQTAIEEVLEEYPSLGGVFCTNADISELYLGTDKARECTAVMVGVDATEKQQEAIRSGDEIGVVSQDPYAIGYQTIWAAVQAMSMGAEVDFPIVLESAWIDAETIDDAASENFLY